MSRIGKQPVPVPSGVTVEVQGKDVRVQGPKGELRLAVRPEVDVAFADGQVTVTASAASRQARAYHGLTRALLNNMVVGVAQGYSRQLDIIGVGWNAEVQGQKVVLNVGYADPVNVAIPDGIEVNTPNPTTIIVSGPDKQAVGQLAARIRKSRPPEPYKGKGVRYAGEQVRQKSGKTFGS